MSIGTFKMNKEKLLQTIIPIESNAKKGRQKLGEGQ